MSLAAIMAATAQQSAPMPYQTQLPAKKPAKTHLGSISPKMGTAKVKVTAVKRARKRKRVVGSKKPRKSRVVYNFTAETLSQYFHLSQRDAAKLLGIAPITMKRNCKRQGIMWPYRAQKIEAAHRVRQDSESVSSENEEDGDGKDTSDDEEDATTATETQAAQALVSMSPAVHAPLVSEAGLVFARLPYLCLEENAVEEERDSPSCVIIVEDHKSYFPVGATAREACGSPDDDPRTLMTPELSVPPSETFSHVTQHHVLRDNAVALLRVLSPQQERQVRAFAIKSARLVKRLYALPETEIAKYFHLSQREAARAFGVATVTLKQMCRRRGINWPTLVKERVECSDNESVEIGLNVSHAPAAPLGLAPNADELRSRL